MTPYHFKFQSIYLVKNIHNLKDLLKNKNLFKNQMQ